MKTQHPTQHLKPKGGKSKGQKEKEGKGGAKAAKFDCLEMNECDQVIEEIPENEVNVATRQINLASALGVGDWGWGWELSRILFYHYRYRIQWRRTAPLSCVAKIC